MVLVACIILLAKLLPFFESTKSFFISEWIKNVTGLLGVLNK
ncbi:MAG: hypothetical protein RLZZ628_3100 [Bacteroidota bacterium]|jgi:hypothetical protein